MTEVVQETVLLWLESVGLGKYSSVFKKEDLDCFDTLNILNEADLERLGLTLGHRKVFIEALRQRRNSKMQRGEEGNQKSSREVALEKEILELKAEIERLQTTIQSKNEQDYDPHAVKILHIEKNPQTNAEILKLQSENNALRDQLSQFQSQIHKSSSSSSSLQQQQQQQQATAANTTNKTVDPDKHAQRLKELFAAQIKTFREFIGAAIGFQITEPRLHEFHLLSMYAERKQDEIILLFDNGKLDLVENEFSLRQKSNQIVWDWLQRRKSLPGFLAQLTLQLLESSTMI